MYESNDDASASREMCEIVERQAHFLAQMIEDVLELSRCRRGSLRVERMWVDLMPIIAAAVETTQPCFAARGHRLTVSLPDQTVALMVDPVRVQQVIANLLANAAKYTEPGGCIRLAVESTPGWVAIEVRDNGMGIPEELLPRVFNLFEQGSVAQNRGWSGLGIGLALVKCLVELHGGSVSAQSDGLGKGSAFVVRLPGAMRSGSHPTSNSNL
jgi:signal transduction histidine kinase